MLSGLEMELTSHSWPNSSAGMGDPQRAAVNLLATKSSPNSKA